MKTKKLAIKDYAPFKTPFNLQEVIQARVNKESYAMVSLPTPETPKYEKPPKMNLKLFFLNSVIAFIP